MTLPRFVRLPVKLTLLTFIRIMKSLSSPNVLALWNVISVQMELQFINRYFFYRVTHMQRSRIAQCMLWPGVCPSVRHSQVLYRNSWTDWADFQHRCFPRRIPRCIVRRFRYLKRIRSLPCGPLSKTLNVADFSAFPSQCVQRCLDLVRRSFATRRPWHGASRGPSATARVSFNR